MNKPTAIDLFCGCGGITAGLESAGFQVLAGVDIEANYIASYRHNFGTARAFEMDLAAVSPQEFSKQLGLNPGELDLLVGGPPCQGFSKNVPRSKRSATSANNMLVKTYLGYCEALAPKLILMENVAEMRNGFEQVYTSEIVDRLGRIGYQIDHAVLNAADFGVPQRRRRAFFLGSRLGSAPRFPVPTHASKTEVDDLFPRPGHVPVWEAIGDLPRLKSGENSDQYAVLPQSDYQRKARGRCQVLKNHVGRKLQPMQQARLDALRPGEGLKQLPDHLRPKAGFSGAYGRLTKDMVAPTITRWVFHPGSGRFGHPVDSRMITMREAARLQGFPDSFEFVGSYTQQAGQIGNAVPPFLAEAIGSALQHYLATEMRAKRSMNSSKVKRSLAAEKAMATA